MTKKPLKRVTGIGAGAACAVDVNDGIAIAAWPEQIWKLSCTKASFPQLMPDVREVRRAEDGRTSHWQIGGAAGIAVRFRADEINRVEGRQTSWRTTEGQLVVRKTSAPPPVDRAPGYQRQLIDVAGAHILAGQRSQQPLCQR